MNFNIRGPSNFSSSSSSFDEQKEQLLTDLEPIDAKQEAIRAQHAPSDQLRSRSEDRRLFYDYFTENPRYNDQMFRRRFRMGRSSFLRIVEKMEARDNCFVQRRDSVGRLSFLVDATDKYIKIGESITIECLKRFCRTIVEEFT
ncbi:hypothetical protein Ddye_000875, partial [Dipteronia dyeriana]